MVNSPDGCGSRTARLPGAGLREGPEEGQRVFRGGTRSPEGVDGGDGFFGQLAEGTTVKIDSRGPDLLSARESFLVAPHVL